MSSAQCDLPFVDFNSSVSSDVEPSAPSCREGADPIAAEGRKPSDRGHTRLEHEAKVRSRAASRKSQSEAELPDQLSGDMRGEYVREQYLSVRNVALRYDCSVPTIWRWVGQRTGFPSPVRLSPGCTRWRLSDLLGFEQQSRGGRK